MCRQPLYYVTQSWKIHKSHDTILQSHIILMDCAYILLSYFLEDDSLSIFIWINVTIIVLCSPRSEGRVLEKAYDRHFSPNLEIRPKVLIITNCWQEKSPSSTSLSKGGGGGGYTPTLHLTLTFALFQYLYGAAGHD